MKSRNKTPHSKGYMALVLHAHLPYVRHLEYDDALEERWLFEAITETYIPLLLMLDKLAADAIDFRLTLSITPTLASMLEDVFLKSRYLKCLEGLIRLAESETIRTSSDRRLNTLAMLYRRHLLDVHDAYINRYQKDLLAAFKHLQDMGKIEIMASAATHGYLPLLFAKPAAVRAQIDLGVQYHRRFFGCTPKGFWLPECGYAAGLDQILAAASIQYTILETNGITRASMRPRYGVHGPVASPAGVAFFGRDPDASQQVWSSENGYPGDYDYREFYRDIAYDLDHSYIEQFVHRNRIATDTGFKYYRITGNTPNKELYDPTKAQGKAVLHAEDFLSKQIRQIEYLHPSMDRPPIIVAPFDAELFGHWWHEGPIWLDSFIRQAHKQRREISLITMSDYLQQFPDNQIAAPSASSWGRSGNHHTWINKRNDWIYPHLHHGVDTMTRLTDKYPQADGLLLRALQQAARELLLAQASDWAFMINSDKTAQYAAHRTKNHLLQLHRLEKEIESQTIDENWLTMIEYRNNIFSEIDPYIFGAPDMTAKNRFILSHEKNHNIDKIHHC